MKPTIIPAASLASVLLACAHAPPSSSGNVARAEERAEARDSTTDRDGIGEPPPDERTVDPVQMPKAGDRNRVATTDTAVPVPAGARANAPSAEYAPDNSGINERDRNNANVTPMDQSNSEIDVELTQRIRKAVMADDSLSFTAKNAKIITRAGRVTLRGPVGSAAEKEAVNRHAVRAAGVEHVTNQLEVEAK